MNALRMLTASTALVFAAAVIPTATSAATPQVRNSTRVVLGKSHVKAKALPKLICEGGEVKTTSSGHTGCSCGLNVRRVAIAKDHFRCDRPEVRNSVKVQGPNQSGVKAKRSSEIEKPTAKVVEPDQTPAAGRPIPNHSTGKPVSACRAPLEVTRNGATSRGWGLTTAIAAWEYAAKNTYGFHMGKWKYASNKDSDCSRSPVLWKCTVTARPCPPS